MPFVNDRVLDAALNIFNNEADRIDICSQEPATHTEATSTYSLGFKDHGAAGSAFGAPGDRSPSGREVLSTAVTDGEVTDTDTATHYGVSDHDATRLLAASSLAAGQVVTDGNAWSMPSFAIGIPDPA